MSKFRKKPVVVEAKQWWVEGTEHPHFEKVIPYFVEHVEPEEECEHCCCPMRTHGWIETLEGGHIVCPGDWVIKGVLGEFYPCKRDAFELTYERIKE